MRVPRLTNLALIAAFASILLAAPMPVTAGDEPLSAAKAATELGRELGVTVSLKGGDGRVVALPPAGPSPESRIAALAEDLGGTWKRTLRVSGKLAATPLPSPALERTLNLGFRDLPANKAFGIVARQIATEWEPTGAPERRVTLPGVSRTARELLDEISRQAGVSWTFEYRIDAPDSEAIRALTQPEPPRPPTPVPTPEPSPDISVTVIPNVPSASVWSKGLKESVHKLLKASPDRRAAALDVFLKEIAGAAVLLQAVTIERRPAYRSAASRLYDQWERLYRGLAPTVRDELDPADAVMRDLLGH